MPEPCFYKSEIYKRKIPLEPFLVVLFVFFCPVSQDLAGQWGDLSREGEREKRSLLK